MAAHRMASRATLRAAVERLEAENDDLACRIPRLAREIHEARVELGGAVEDRRYANATAATLYEQLTAEVVENHRLRTQLARLGAMTVPRWARSTDGPEDEATEPIPAGDMWTDPARWRAADTGTHVIPLHHRSV